jgi:hypothetical protein
MQISIDKHESSTEQGFVHSEGASHTQDLNANFKTKTQGAVDSIPFFLTFWLSSSGTHPADGTNSTQGLPRGPMKLLH